MAPTGEAFVRSVMRALGATSPAELAEAMQWKRGTERLVAKWLAGNNNPSYTRTMEMLERCGWLSTAAGDGATAAQPPDPLERIAAGVTELLKDQRAILRKLDAQPAPQKQPARARTKRQAKAQA